MAQSEGPLFGRVRPRSPSLSPPRGPILDETLLEATFQDASMRPVEEVEEYFASQLDRSMSNFTRLSPEEKRANIYKLLDDYYSYARKRVDALKHQRRTQVARAGGRRRATLTEMDVHSVDDDSLSVTQEDVRRSEEEAQTWDLLRRILPRRYDHSVATQPKLPANPQARTRSDWWDDFVFSESGAKDRKIVLEWLQHTASQGPSIDDAVSELQEHADRGDILAHGWLHTRSKIKLQKKVNGYVGAIDPKDGRASQAHLSSSTLITQLDPDAITRQGRKLESQDDFFERAIWLGCYEMLRRGCAMSEIRDWCSVRTEMWRAASITPLPLSREGDEEQATFEPYTLVLWRRVCFATARDGGTGDYDRAVYGLLAGDISSVEPICKSWHDFLFAHYNAFLRTQFDSFLLAKLEAEQARTVQQFGACNVIQHRKDPGLVAQQLMSTLEKDPRTSEEASRTIKILQGAIITNQLSAYIYRQGCLLAKLANMKRKSKLIPQTFLHLPEFVNPKKLFDLADHEGLRMLAHIFIIHDALEQLMPSLRRDEVFESCHMIEEHSLAAYISYLRLAQAHELIPLYCSKLSGARAYETMSRNLIHMDTDEDRTQQLAIMRKLGLDVGKFVTTQPDLYLRDAQEKAYVNAETDPRGKFRILEEGGPSLKYGHIVIPDFFGEDPDLVDTDDEHIIRSLEWLMLVPALFKETCIFAIRAYKLFLKRVNLRAARELSKRISASRIVLEKSPVADVRGPHDPTDSGAGWFEDFCSFGMSDEFLAACKSDSAELVVTVRNLWELECFVNALDAVETLSSLASLMREQNYDKRELTAGISLEIRRAKTCMQPVLKNWLLVVNEEDPDWNMIREAYLPETILAFVSSLHFAGVMQAKENLLECMELAAVIAEKGSDVAQQFIKAGRMKLLLDAFASSSKALAIWSSDKKGPQKQSGKMKGLGWSKELWSVSREGRIE